MLADSHDEFYDPEKVDPSQEGHSGDVDSHDELCVPHKVNPP